MQPHTSEDSSYPPGVITRTYQQMHLMPFPQQAPGQISSYKSGCSGDKCTFHHELNKALVIEDFQILPGTRPDFISLFLGKLLRCSFISRGVSLADGSPGIYFLQFCPIPGWRFKGVGTLQT